LSQRTASAERDQPLAIAFADDAQYALVQVDLAVPQAYQFRHAQPGRVQHLEHRAVAMAEWIGGLRRREQSIDLRFSERARQAPPDFRHCDLRRRVLLDHGLAHEVAEEAPEARELARRRARAGARLHAPGDESEQVVARSAVEGSAALPQPARERGQVGAVGGQRVRRQAALHPHGVEKTHDHRLGNLAGFAGGREGRCTHRGRRFHGCAHGPALLPVADTGARSRAADCCDRMQAQYGLALQRSA
jgi:hypothetical protein